MSKTTKQKLIPCLIVGCLLLGLVAATFSYYNSEVKVNNPFETKGSGVFVTEIFSSDDRWLPGETKEKEVTFGNSLSVNQVIRFTVTTEWFNNDGSPGQHASYSPWSYEDAYTPPPLVINWTGEIPENKATDPSWTKIGDYYYYNRVLEAQSGAEPTQTLPVMQSVTFSPDISNDGVHSEDFSNKLCRVSISMEAVAVNPDVTNAAWGVRFTQTNDTISWT